MHLNPKPSLRAVPYKTRDKKRTYVGGQDDVAAAAVSTPRILPKDVGIVIRLFRILSLSRRVANYDDVISLGVTSPTMLFTSTTLPRMTSQRQRTRKC